MSTTNQPKAGVLVSTANFTHTPPDCTCEHRSYIPTKWAMRLVGKDEQGRDCILGLDWRGRWHQIAGPVYKPVMAFAAGERAIADGNVIQRCDNRVLLSDPPQVWWREIESGRELLLAGSDPELEVAP